MFLRAALIAEWSKALTLIVHCLAPLRGCSGSYVIATNLLLSLTTDRFLIARKSPVTRGLVFQKKCFVFQVTIARLTLRCVKWAESASARMEGLVLTAQEPAFPAGRVIDMQYLLRILLKH